VAAIDKQVGAIDHLRRPRGEEDGGGRDLLGLGTSAGGNQRRHRLASGPVLDATLREALMQHETMRRGLNLARSADCARMGTGDLGPDSHMARTGWFSAEEIRHAQASGVVGDLMGCDFFARSGEARNEELGGRAIGRSRADLRRIGNTIAIAAEPSKAMSILGALRTGAIDILATTIANCHAILDLVRQEGAPTA
jgi:DNA-binding transcriptional regulator LsrR (DeoR family)